jgi:hypothetical protein
MGRGRSRLELASKLVWREERDANVNDLEESLDEVVGEPYRGIEAGISKASAE